MTKEEKAKAYDEALERAKEDISSGILARRETARYIFPELRESSEEMVRRTIISTLYRDDYLSTEEVNECVAWLEKQRYSEFELENEYWKGYDDAKFHLKEDKVTVIGAGSNSASISDGDNSVTSKEVVSQPTTIKPKFKVGDWIVDNNGTVHHIEEIVSVNNETLYGCDDNSVLDVAFQEQYHLWTIQDAKDGDVLVDSYSKDSIIILYKGIYKERSILAHCGWNGYNLSIKTNGLGYGGLDNTNYSPATKEQRDLLFSKMREAGYEWDSEKKELKKIHNALEECEIENIEHGKYYYCIKDYYSGGCKRASKGEVVQALRGMSMMSLGVKANEYFIPVKGVRPSCSEEDEEVVELTNDAYLSDTERDIQWVIQDAKDGDIIYIKSRRDDSEWLLIFKKIKSQNSYIHVFDYYALSITSDYVYHDSNGFWGFLTNSDIVCPATKEQCDLLFQKIKEKGYEWDAENKVLRKISQEYPLTPDECVKPAWSKEDEETFNFILKELDLYCDSNKIRKIVAWLKSLKERIKNVKNR